MDQCHAQYRQILPWQSRDCHGNAINSSLSPFCVLSRTLSRCYDRKLVPKWTVFQLSILRRFVIIFLIIFLFLPLPRYYPISFSLLRFAPCFFFLAFFTSYHRFNGLSILIEASLLARAAKHRDAYKISINRHPEGWALLFLVARTKAKLFDYVIGLPAAPVIIVAAVLSSLRTNSYFRQ